MKQILGEVKESIARKKLFSFLLMILSAAFFFLLTALYIQYFNVDTKTKSYYAQYNGESIYQLSDQLINEREKQFFSSPSELQILKNFYEELNQKEDSFTYIYTNAQPIGVSGFKGSDKLLYGYEYNALQPAFEKSGELFKTAKALQINENVIKKFTLPLSSGRMFKGGEFVKGKEEELPVILGADYSMLYQTGDTFNIDYLNYPLKARVIGILQSDVTLPVRDSLETYVDRYIIMPNLSMGEPGGDLEFSFQQKHYLSSVNGQIFTKLGKLKARQVAEAVSEKTGFYDYQLIGANDEKIDFMLSMLSVNKQLLAAITLLLFFFSVMSISISLLIKWNLNVKKYAIHLVSGASIHHIFIYMFAELALLMLISLLSVFIYTSLIGFLSIGYYIFMMLSLIIIICTGLLPIFMKLKRLHLAEMLKRKV